MRSPIKRNVDTLSDGSLTNAMKATHKPMAKASMSNQWPVRIQMQTMETERENDINSATVNRPQNPNDILNEKQEMEI